MYQVYFSPTLCRCWICIGRGIVTCDVCQGTGRLKYYTELTITWKTHSDDHIVDTTTLPKHMVSNAKGQEVFREKRSVVSPVTSYPNRSVRIASRRLVDFHSSAHASSYERILMQVKLRVYQV